MPDIDVDRLGPEAGPNARWWKMIDNAFSRGVWIGIIVGLVLGALSASVIWMIATGNSIFS